MKKVLSLLAIVAVVACGGRTADTNLPAGMGGIKVQLHGLTPGGTTMGEIIIQNVFDPSQIILQNCVAKPETLNGMAFCDEMNVLPPGVYEIKVESQTGCRMTQDHYKAVVNAGQTTEVRIDLVCDGGNAAGGLDVVVTENHYPQIDNITFNFQSGLPGNKFICQFATRPTVVTLQVEDAETPCAGLTAQWSLDGAVVPVPTNLISAVAGPIDTAGVCTFTETLNQSAPIGTYNLDVLLSDGTLTTTFGYIVHIIDCGNPAPVDQLIDCDGSATGGSGCAGAPGVPFDPRLTIGATLSDFPSSAFELAGLDWMDNDGNQQWTFGVDSLMAEGEQCGPGAVKNGVFDDHTGAHDCPVVQGAPALFDGQQVSCDIEINFQWLGWSCASPVSHIRYFDVNGNGQYDLGEPLVLDTNNDGIYN